MTEFTGLEKLALANAELEIKRANEKVAQIKKDKADREKQNSYAVQSKILGTPEWERETMLKQERQVQADSATEQMFKHGINELIEHIKKNGSIYGLKLGQYVATSNGFSGTYTLTLHVSPHK